jgi:hypothetical protein
MTNTVDSKNLIIAKFISNVKGKTADNSAANSRHDGRSGHWLERQMGIEANSSNTPDILGFEMKNDTTSKTTFGDWSPDESIFKRNKLITRDEFLRIFGKPNVDKNNRYSWSGEPAPKVKIFNKFGQMLTVDSQLNIHAIYSYSKDLRSSKSAIIPTQFKVDNLILAKWSKDIIQKKLERKFNKNGWFKCLHDANGVYTEIVFGNPMDYTNWINLVKLGVVFFDSGMYQGNPRPYAQWRANNNYWDSLIVSRHR